MLWRYYSYTGPPEVKIVSVDTAMRRNGTGMWFGIHSALQKSRLINGDIKTGISVFCYQHKRPDDLVVKRAVIVTDQNTYKVAVEIVKIAYVL